MRVFSSAPIVKRYDVFTLETADGICVLLKGFINKLRTNDNGFPSTVPCSFLFCSIFCFFQVLVWKNDYQVGYCGSKYFSDICYDRILCCIGLCRGVSH